MLCVFQENTILIILTPGVYSECSYSEKKNDAPLALKLIRPKILVAFQPIIWHQFTGVKRAQARKPHGLFF